MRTAFGLLSLIIAGGIAPVGLSAISYVAPLLAGSIAALLSLLALCLMASVLSRRYARELGPLSARPAPRRGMVVRSAEHRAT